MLHEEDTCIFCRRSIIQNLYEHDYVAIWWLKQKLDHI